MLEQKTVQIGDTEFVIQQLPATRGMEVGIHLVQIIMGATEGIESVREGQEILDAEYNPAKMASGLMGKIDEQGTPAFIKRLIQESMIRPDTTDGFSDWYEAHFSANFDELFDLVTVIIEHNGYVVMLKKKFQEVMEIFSLEDGEGEESTPS